MKGSSPGASGDKKGPIPYNRTFLTGGELENITRALDAGHLSGGGQFARACEKILEQACASSRALLTHSCTGALELAALALEIQPGDEVIMPSYTFPSTANAFVLRGATPVYVDIREDTLNIDENLLGRAVTSKTKAIVPVHYAGIPCEMDRIMQLADENNLAVVEDAAQGILSTYHGRPLGGIGQLGALSFHATKNIISGEGGALLVNDPEFVTAAEIGREKGTDRSLFLRGEIDKYSWRSVGSSYMPAEIVAAVLQPQLEQAREIIDQRLILWNRYHELLESFEQREWLRRPSSPEGCQHNAHLYYVVLNEAVNRQEVISAMADVAVCTSHFEPLHTSTFGSRFHAGNSLKNTESIAASIVRLPLWLGLTSNDQEKIVNRLYEILGRVL